MSGSHFIFEEADGFTQTAAPKENLLALLCLIRTIRR